ncbi:hypothetical protein G6O69_16245 [Pseudenhygromyxa sp. WMMC2535]|uniref:hypothetical protein n=1 Tax=Pseudenhygromyxa sp. WMMC2535 TaxID=2712867 RepID=UPI001552056A|nr:hypothetical protein [Pseudenhygromyxa sp. WMMC2535]NVB39394.1 hypothetical protein [Pseudenhygromyxa sp. WMMC2535]
MDELSERFALAERQGLIDIVRTHPNLPLLEFLELIQHGRTGRLLGSLTVAECQAGAAKAEALESSEFQATADKTSQRAAYDAQVVDALRKANEPLTPAEVHALVGGTIRQARVALQRLAAAGKVARTWKARSQSYRLV